MKNKASNEFKFIDETHKTVDKTKGHKIQKKREERFMHDEFGHRLHLINVEKRLLEKSKDFEQNYFVINVDNNNNSSNNNKNSSPTVSEDNAHYMHAGESISDTVTNTLHVNTCKANTYTKLPHESMDISNCAFTDNTVNPSPISFNIDNYVHPTHSYNSSCKQTSLNSPPSVVDNNAVDFEGIYRQYIRQDNDFSFLNNPNNFHLQNPNLIITQTSAHTDDNNCQRIVISQANNTVNTLPNVSVEAANNNSSIENYVSNLSKEQIIQLILMLRRQ
ncbi:hypothetical protein ABK040_013402 [Willaertia magna]